MPVSGLPICDAYIRAGQELGIPYNHDFNGKQQAGVGFYQLTQRDRRRSSASLAYLKPIRDRKNLTVRTGVMVTRIVLDKGRAVGVDGGRPPDGVAGRGIAGPAQALTVRARPAMAAKRSFSII